jgi:protoporphyrin/coproporphyrin ferrochelatase
MENSTLLLNMGRPNNLSEVEIFLNNMFNNKRIIAAQKLIRYCITTLITFKRKNKSRSTYNV